MFGILAFGVRKVGKLVVLVGPAGSGKTTFCSCHREWAVVSKDDIRRNVFHRDFDLRYEDTVESIFAATLVEAVQSSVEVVCVDNTNLTRAERRALIEVAQDSGREPIAYVMASKPRDVLYNRKLEQLHSLASSNKGIAVGGFPEDRYSMIYKRYEQVAEDEGFVKVFKEVEPLASIKKKRVRAIGKKEKATLRRLDAFPLFGQLG